jgi:hypothetical protein
MRYLALALIINFAACGVRANAHFQPIRSGVNTIIYAQPPILNSNFSGTGWRPHYATSYYNPVFRLGQMSAGPSFFAGGPLFSNPLRPSPRPGSFRFF